jgi:hypothetical protein
MEGVNGDIQKQKREIKVPGTLWPLWPARNSLASLDSKASVAA